MSYSTLCVHRGGNIIDSPRNLGLIRLNKCHNLYTFLGNTTKEITRKATHSLCESKNMIIDNSDE